MQRLRALALLALSLLALPALAQGGGEVALTVKPSKPAVTPGDQLVIAVVFDHQPGWHIHTHDPIVPPEMEGFIPHPTAIELVPAPHLTALPVQWPAVHQVEVRLAGDPALYGVFDGRAVAFLPLRIAESATPGTEVEFALKIGFQACDDSVCIQPETREVSLKLPVITLEAAAQQPQPPTDPDFASFDPASFSRNPEVAGPAPRTPPASTAVRFEAFGAKFTIDPTGPLGLSLLLLTAALGGFLLNLTPCVMPVIPIKIMGLSQAAGNPARCLYLGILLSLGVIAFWMAIGLAIASISEFTAISSLFRTPWFSLGVGVFIAAMAVGMLGVFTVRLPQAVYLVSPNHETARGSFVFGVMTAVLSTPCTAPFMGSAAAWAATQSPLITLSTFGAIGGGMALPYLVLSARPQWVSRVPRTGPASELVKQVMGMLMLAVAAFFLGIGIVALVPGMPEWAKGAYWWGVAAFVTAAGLWLIIRTFQITVRPGVRGVWTLVGGGLTAAFIYLAVMLGIPDKSIPWQPYTPELLADVRERPVVRVIDFTADWCLNCKTLELAVLGQKRVTAALNAPDVVAVKVDLTAADAAGWKLLKDFGAVGIPLLVVEGRGLPEPFQSNAYTPQMVLDAIGAARGAAPLAQRPLEAVDTPKPDKR